MLNKTLANINQEYIKKRIHNDQVDFIPEIQGWLNICELINVIKQTERQKTLNYPNRYIKGF